MTKSPGPSFLCLLACLSCADLAPYRRDSGRFAALDLRRESPTRLGARGAVQSMADDGARQVVLTDDGPWIIRGQTIERAQGQRHWLKAALIPAADGAGTWAVAIDADGHLCRLRPGVDPEDVGARYGLEHEQIADVATAGGRLVALLLKDAYAIADGARVTRYPAQGVRAVTGGGTRVAVRFDERVDVIDGLLPTAQNPHGTPRGRSFRMKAPTAVALTARGQLFVAAGSALYRENSSGGLSLIYLSAGAPGLTSVVAAGFALWFADGTTLGHVEDGSTALTTAPALAPTSRLLGAGDGRVWALAGGQVTLLATNRESSSAADWDNGLGAVFTRACSECHLPGGRSDVDLSSASAWAARRDEIRERVLVKHTMPPAGRALSEDDAAAVRSWTHEAQRFHP